MPTFPMNQAAHAIVISEHIPQEQTVWLCSIFHAAESSVSITCNGLQPPTKRGSNLYKRFQTALTMRETGLMPPVKLSTHSFPFV